MNKNEENLLQTLNKLEWPSLFPFKFIIPVAKLDELLLYFQLQETKIRFSKNGNYVSLSVTPYLLNPEKVLEVYREVGKIKGIISL
jgi:uncharacterized protein